MLHRLIIQNYALIDNLDITFSAGLNIITGETGAGKSIMLGALSLILGQRAESKYFYNQQKKCIIEGHFQSESNHLADFFAENDLDLEDEVILRREISAEGKSRAFINDTPVNLTVLKQLGEQLIDIHSQHAVLEVNDENFQRLVVDTLAGHDLLLQQYRENYKKYKSFLKHLQELIRESEQAKADQDYYQFQFDELENAGLHADEQETLEQELAALTHAEEIKRNLLSSHFLLDGQEQSALAMLKEALLQLQSAGKYQTHLEALAERLNSSLIEIKDIASEIETLEQQTQVNEARASEVNERLTLLYSLQKKHRVNTVNELLEVQENLSAKLQSISSSDEEIKKLDEEVNRLKKELIVLSETLSASRSEIIPVIEEQVKKNLEETGMPNAVLKIENILLGQELLGSYGRNEIRFLFSANKGQEPGPISKIASGGELSRFMLSIKSLIARHTALPTLIFDEIDTGVSGEIALRVGNMMEKLAENLQVIAITHLPQIAGKGSSHYKVYKDEAGDKTRTHISLLDEDERIIEIAKMLSGENPGEAALQHARELRG